MIRIAVTTGPASEPITTAEAKNWLKIRSGVTTDDTLIAGLVESARLEHEHESGEYTITRTVVEYRDTWPIGRVLQLTMGPVSAITSVQYKDEAGDTQTFSSGSYTTDIVGKHARIVLNEDTDWPDLFNGPNAVFVTYAAGYANADAVPESVKTAILVRLAMHYQNREDMPLSGMPGKRAFESLARRRRRAIL